MKDISLSKILQDVSALIGSLLPIAQLFFGQWIYAFDNVFLAKEQFMGISIITLIVSYIFIIAYLTKPYSELILPGQRGKNKRLQAYWNMRNILERKVNVLSAAPEISEKALVSAYKELQKLEQPDIPYKISQDNYVSVSVTLVIVCSLIFVALAFTINGGWIISCIQAVAYVLLIAFAALVLTIYKKVNDNNVHWKENNRARANKAIKLAIDANGFGDLPQVTFVSQNETGDFGSQFHVRAKYKGEIFDIITDREADFLISVMKQDDQQELSI